MEDFLIREFYQQMRDVDCNAYGIVDGHNHVHTLGTDSKIIGRLFEIFVQPVLEQIAAKHQLLLKTPESQTAYPDFVMMSDEQSVQKIAIDVKTTYIDDKHPTIKFTLGSYASYMRNNTKNIEYRYTDYARHYVIGFVYKRNDRAQASRVVDYGLRHEIVFPYRDVRYFIQEKYKISGDRPGSRNTENIGSISSRDFDDFVHGRGPFAKLGEAIFDLYWKYYPKYRSNEKDYVCLDEFMKWIPLHIQDTELLYPFSREDVLHRMAECRERVDCDED